MRGAPVQRAANQVFRRNVEAPAFAFTDVRIQRISQLAEQPRNRCVRCAFLLYDSLVLLALALFR
jgi:hypothetical protein